MIKKNFETQRQKTLFLFLTKYSTELVHSKQVCDISLTIFDKTKGLLHDFGEQERELLEAGALLHDIGYHISAEKHHKNSYKIIKTIGLEGYDESETDIIANIARYHRNKLPSDKHENFNNLTPQTKLLVERLGGIVRLADGLDRSHSSTILDVDCEFDKETATLKLILKAKTQDCYPEIYAGEKKRDLLEKAFDIAVLFTISK